MVWLAISLISNRNNAQGGGCSTCSSHFAIAIHSLQKVYSLVKHLTYWSAELRSHSQSGRHENIASVHFSNSFANQTVIIGVWLSNLEHNLSIKLGFVESIYTTVAISIDGYSTDLLKGKRPTCVKSECNACKHMLLAMYMYLPSPKSIRVHACV